MNSVQRSQNKDDIVSFPWTSVIEEARVHCPTLYNVLHLVQLQMDYGKQEHVIIVVEHL